MLTTMGGPILTLIGWTFIMWVWLYATRIPAMRKAGLTQPGRLKTKADLDVLPQSVRNVADNYNHLHEQPVIFYALALYSQGFGVADPLNIGLAWGYVVIRIVHSLVQATINVIPLRFALFSLATLLLIAVFVRNMIALTLS